MTIEQKDLREQEQFNVELQELLERYIFRLSLETVVGHTRHVLEVLENSTGTDSLQNNPLVI